MFPRSGGVYVFLHEGFGPRAAFIFGWTYLLITQPMAAAGIATVFSEHANRLFGIDLDVRIVTCGLIVLLTWLNVTGMRRGAGVAVALTGLKALALALIVVVALVLMKGSGANFASTPSPQPFVFALAPVLAAILWTYDGWSDTVAVAEEITEPQRRIPRIFLLGTLGTMALYLAVNATYIWLVPLSEMRETATVAPLVMQRLVGPAGSTLVTIMILVSTLGATHASLIVGSRVIFAQARDRLTLSSSSARDRWHCTWMEVDVSLGEFCSDDGDAECCCWGRRRGGGVDSCDPARTGGGGGVVSLASLQNKKKIKDEEKNARTPGIRS
jgi:APA family basic amino acid/polyamine antiporter